MDSRLPVPSAKNAAVHSDRRLTASEFQGLADVPPELEWFANIDNPQTRRAYQNGRELENAIERAIVLGKGEEIGPEDLPSQVGSGTGPQLDYAQFGYHGAVEAFKQRIIEDALQRTEGNQSKAAERLGIQRTFLSRLLKKMGLR